MPNTEKRRHVTEVVAFIRNWSLFVQVKHNTYPAGESGDFLRIR
jgi:hypothetical protein